MCSIGDRVELDAGVEGCYLDIQGPELEVTEWLHKNGCQWDVRICPSTHWAALSEDIAHVEERADTPLPRLTSSYA
jgi:hypothetical protein